MIGNSVFRSTTLGDFGVAIIYSVIGVVVGMVLIAIALITSASTQIEFPTTNDGAYGFLMKSVQDRVPLARVGGGTVSAPQYNSGYTTFGVSTGSPISPTHYYSSTVPFSTSAWWSRLVSQKAPTDYTPAMPYAYCGTFNLYRSKTVPSFAITIARPYSLGGVNIPATKVCGQDYPSTLHSRSFNISDGAPTCFTAPILWNFPDARPYNLGTEMTYNTREAGNMTAEMNYVAVANGQALRITLSEMVPYLVYTLSPGASASLNSLYQDGLPVGSYSTVMLIDIMAGGPPPIITPNASHMKFKTAITTPPFTGRLPPVGQSQTSIIMFEMTITPPATVTQLVDSTVIVTADGSALTPTKITILPTHYYIANPHIVLNPTYWVNLDSRVVGTILAAPSVNILRAFISATSRNGRAVITYASDSGQPVFFVPSLSMLTVGTITGASPVDQLSPPDGISYWLSPQGLTSVYVAAGGSFDVSYPLTAPPPLGTFDIYSAFDANSLRRLSFVFNRDLEALAAIDVANDSFYVSVRKIFTFAQMTYAVFNYPASLLINALLPPLRTHLLRSLDALIQSNRAEIQLGYNPQLFTVATGDQQYGYSQNQVFGDNHVGQYGMILFIYYIAVSIQFDNTARRSIRDRYQTVMIDLMRDFAQPYITDQYIPSMRHFDYGTGISWQTSSIIEASSLQVSEVINGYYACWLVSSLFGDNKLRDYYRAILSVEMATHQQYRLASLAPQSAGGQTAAIYKMITTANALYTNCKNTEFGTGPPGGYTTLGTMVYLIQGGEIVLHSLRNDHPDYKYLVDNVNPNTVADFSSTTFFKPITPLTRGIVPLVMGINLNSFQTVVFVAAAGASGQGSAAPPILNNTHQPGILVYDTATGLPATIITLESSPPTFMTMEAAYSLSSYATNYVTNYTWAGANLPAGTCAVIPATSLPSYLEPVMQFNKLGILDSNTVLWIQYVISANGPRKT